jgi:hypothetical protein
VFLLALASHRWRQPHQALEPAQTYRTTQPPADLPDTLHLTSASLVLSPCKLPPISQHAPQNGRAKLPEVFITDKNDTFHFADGATTGHFRLLALAMRRDELGNPVPVEGVAPAVSNTFVVSALNTCCGRNLCVCCVRRGGGGACSLQHLRGKCTQHCVTAKSFAFAVLGVEGVVPAVSNTSVVSALDTVLLQQLLRLLCWAWRGWPLPSPIPAW